MRIQQIPLLESVDAVVLGAGSAAVSAALKLQSEGRRVFVISDRSYFGEESAGALEERPGGGLGRPGSAKHALECSLMEAGIDFLFMSRPVAVVPAEEGRLHLVVAYRTSLLVIRTSQILDASIETLLFTLPGLSRWVSRAPRALQRSKASLTVVTDSTQPFSLEGVALRPVGELMEFPERSRRDQVIALPQRATLPVESDRLATEKAAQEARIRNRFFHPAIDLSADAVRWNWQEEGATSPRYDHAADLPDESFALHPQFWICGTELPLSPSGLETLYNAEAMRELGERVAAAMLAQALSPEETGKMEGSPATQENLRFAPTFLRRAREMVQIELPEFPQLGEFDVVVAGGGTGGAPAGIAAARSGRRALVLEQQRMLGGVGTAGSICSYWFGNKTGFTRELDSDLFEADPLYRHPERKRPPARWNSELKATWYLHQLHSAGGEAWLGSFAFGVRMEGQRITGVLVSTPYGTGLVPCSAVVDASGNADIAAAAGAPCRVIDALHSAVQGAGLSPRRIGQHYVNTDFTFIDDTDPRGLTYAHVHARAKFKSEFDTTSLVNTRERRQIIGRVTLSPLDFLAGRTFPDVINIAQSNFDTHGFTIHPVFGVVAPDHSPLSANVPLRCLMPQEVSGLLVTGLGMSAHRDSLPVIRMQADVQNQGYAAGLAAAMACEHQGDFDALDIRALQQKLVDLDALPEEALRWKDSFPLPATAIEQAAQTTPLTLFAAAILLAHPKESAPLLRGTLEQPASEEQTEEAALLLGIMGDAAAVPTLIRLIRERSWDDGWNYRGMGQFGMSASRLDVLIMALGSTSTPEAIPTLVEKIDALGDDATFSHCRAVSLAASSYGTPELGGALFRLLNREAMQGHAITSFLQGVKEANDDPVETASRNRSLRELYLAKALYLCGDCEGLGRRILETYRSDLRGPYARHAAAVLDAPAPNELRRFSA